MDIDLPMNNSQWTIQNFNPVNLILQVMSPSPLPYPYQVSYNCTNSLRHLGERNSLVEDNPVQSNTQLNSKFTDYTFPYPIDQPILPGFSKHSYVLETTRKSV